MSELSTKAGGIKQTGPTWKTGKTFPLARIFLFAFCCFVVPIRTALASDVDYSKASINELVDSLALIDSQAPGIDSAAMYGGFIADGTPVEFQGGVLGFSPPKVPPQMRELVRRGLSALRALIAHLDDARPTKLAVGNDEDGADPQRKRVVGFNRFMFTVFSGEYDPRLRGSQRTRGDDVEKPLKGKYIVKVGDVCYALIGQIVNRRLLSVRYQPSAGLVVNSPIEMPILIEHVKNDWDKADDEALRGSLLEDIRANKEPYLYEPALTRLRFYYPDIYRGLKDADLKKKNEFEARKASKKSN